MRADSFFTNLTKRQSMLLLTAVTFGGAEGAAAFDHLPDDEAEVLKERAERLMQVPREKRIPFLVQEIKRLVMGRKGGDLRGADPRQVVEALRGERPALAEVILRALPAQLADQVRNELPPAKVKLTREVRPEILQVIRWHFERQLQKLAPRQAGFLFPDVHNLSAKDLLTLADHLGADELGPALAGLEPAARDELLKGFSAEQRALAAKVAGSSAARRLPGPEAEAMVKDYVGEDPRHAVRRAGLRRLVRACLAESPEFASRLAERHRDELGRMLIGGIRAERVHGRPKNGERLKVDVVARLEHLAERGLVERPVRLAPPPMALRVRAPTEQPAEPPRVSRSSIPPVPRPPASEPPRRPRVSMEAPSRPPTTGVPTARPVYRSKIKRDPDGSSIHRMPERPAPGEVPIVRAPTGQIPRDPSGSAIHRMTAGRPKVVRGDAAAQARPARHRDRSGDDDR
ncbi:MAG: hypothetical protein JST54_33470 [Deltaproteobacteria bacterium]|nr:hypothetical protein [Deltaproteobacteria bacterium]